MKHTTGIYKITNTKNGKVYIGQSVNIARRWRQHQTRAFNSEDALYNAPLYRAIRKYGLHAFNFDIIEQCETSELNNREIFWINAYKSDTNKCGYNLTAGGHHSQPQTLTRNDALKIQNLLSSTTWPQQQIAEAFHVTQRTVSYINRGVIWNNENLQYPIRSRKVNPTLCPNCGKPMQKSSQLCRTCNIQRRAKQYADKHPVPLPTREELKTKIRKHTISNVARKYQVSPATIRRWCKRFNLPYSKRYIDTLGDDEWQFL